LIINSRNRHLRLVERVGRRDLVVEQRAYRVVADPGEHRAHHEHGQEQRQPDQDLVGRGLGQPQRLPQQ